MTIPNPKKLYQRYICASFTDFIVALLLQIIDSDAMDMLDDDEEIHVPTIIKFHGDATGRKHKKTPITCPKFACFIRKF